MKEAWKKKKKKSNSDGDGNGNGDTTRGSVTFLAAATGQCCNL